VVTEHISLARAVARSLHEKLPVHVPFDDLAQAGCVGLCEAAITFRKSMGVEFASYAKYRVRGAILDHLRGLDHLSRDMRRLINRVEDERRLAEQETGAAISTADLAARLGRKEEDLTTLEISAQPAVEIDACHPDRDLPPRLLTDPGATPEDDMRRQELGAALVSVVECLSPRYRAVINLYYHEHLTMMEIGRRLGVNESRISQIHKAALEHCRAEFERRGIHSAAF